VWMPLCWDADWRWGESDTSSYWYPDVQLVRQSVAGEWKAVMEQLAKDLQAFVKA
jgi:transcription initiation factor IIE alpha subunit